jgi:hypothetical protein
VTVPLLLLVLLLVLVLLLLMRHGQHLGWPYAAAAPKLSATPVTECH